MPRVVEQVVFSKIRVAEMKRVAAYARVSSSKDAMHHSLSAQVSYYSSLIQSKPGWVYCGVYADEAVTGTKDTRENFVKLLDECRAGKIDMILTKSISRFARNTVTLLSTVRELKDLGVDVYFEEQNIHSMGSNGELMLTILASFAQEESLSASENQKWRIKKNFEEGKPWNCTVYGYRNVRGTLVVHEQEADIVKTIYAMFLDGKGILSIQEWLNSHNIPTRFNRKWTHRAVSVVLRNEMYTGNLLLQKTFRENHITKRQIKNEGQLPKYRVEQTHEAIIDEETFFRVQLELLRKKEKHNKGVNSCARYPFSGMIKCECCGATYKRKITPTRVVWICSTLNSQGKTSCPSSKQIPDDALETAVKKALNMAEFCEDAFKNTVELIYACEHNMLKFLKKDGSVLVAEWIPPSRKDSWTEEKRQMARERKENYNARCNSYSSNN